MSAAPHLRVVAQQPFGKVESADWPLVPDGEYLATYVGHSCVALKQFKGAPRMFLRMRLVDAGAHSGKVLFRAYRLKSLFPNGHFTIARRSHLLKMLRLVLNANLKPDRVDLDQIKSCVLRVTTRTVTKDSEQDDLPPLLRYSVIDKVLGLETIAKRVNP